VSETPEPEPAEKDNKRDTDSNELICAICKDHLTPEASARLQPCHHTQFCKDCIVTWLKRNATCPTCRAEVEAVQTGDEVIDIEELQEEEEEGQEILDPEEWLEREWLLEEEEDLDDERHNSVFRVSGEGIQIYQDGEWGPLR
jgi:hypothetical protein